jgi:uncharacterized protein with PQ loop repeat|tara:strand:+ start:4407 stop:4676 length:270 start_codon:yes stop_codon:yes gene_type:complete
MNVDNTIASMAVGIGFIQMYLDINRSKKMDETSKNALLLSIVASCLWFIYQYRLHGINFMVMYTTIGILVQLYILNNISAKEVEPIILR